MPTSRSALDDHAGWLRAQPDPVLTALLARRPDVLVVPPAGFRELASRLAQSHSCSLALARLDASCGQVAALVATLGGRATLGQLVALLPAGGPELPQALRDRLEELARSGLVWPGEEPDSWCCPAGVGVLVPGLLADVPGDDLLAEPTLEPGPAPTPEPAAGAVLALLHELRALLRLLDESPSRPLQAGGLGVQEQRRLARALGADRDRCGWLLDLAGSAGLVAAGADAGRLTTEADAWLALDDPAAAAALLGAVLARARGPRRAGDPSAVLGHAASPDGLLPLAEVAEPVAAAAGALEDEAVLRWLVWRHPAALGGVPALRERLGQLAALGLRAEGAAAPWLRPLLAGDRAGAEALLAAACPPSQPDAVWQADGTAVVATRPDPGLRRLLAAVADQEGDRTWRLAPARVRRALDEGWEPAALLAELAARSRHPLPQALERRVRDETERHGQVRLVTAQTVLHVADPALAAALLALPGLGLAQVAPGVLCSPRPADTVWRALREAGHAPVGDGRPEQRPRRAAPRPAAEPWRPAAPEQVVAALRAAPAATPPPPPPPTVAGDTRRLLERTRHLTPGERLVLLRAVASGDPVELDYVDAGGNPTTRVVQELQDTGHLLVGWCRLREDERSFDPLGILGVRAR